MQLFEPLAARLALGVALALALCSPTAVAQTAPPPAAPAAAPTAPPRAPPPAAYPYGRYPYGGYPYPPYPYPYPAYPGYRGYPHYAEPEEPPRVLPYREGQRIPPGYYLDESIRRGPAIAGAIVLGAPYAISVSVASGYNFDNSSGWLLLPVAGPFITAAARHSTCGSDSYCTDDESLRTMLVLDGLMQTTGAVLLIWGLSTTHKRLVRENALVVMPRRVGSGYGLGVLGTL